MHDINWDNTGKVTSHRIDENSSETRLILMMDSMSQRYGVLPSRLLSEADTFDLMVFDVAITYQDMQHKKQNKSNPNPKLFNQDDLRKKFDQVRNKNGNTGITR